MSWYVYLPLSLNSANQTRSKSMSLRLFWFSPRFQDIPHDMHRTQQHVSIAPKSFGATECPENVDEKPRRHESFDEKSSLFIGICWFTPWCMHSPEQIWYMERIFSALSELHMIWYIPLQSILMVMLQILRAPCSRSVCRNGSLVCWILSEKQFRRGLF